MDNKTVGQLSAVELSALADELAAGRMNDFILYGWDEWDCFKSYMQRIGYVVVDDKVIKNDKVEAYVQEVENDIVAYVLPHHVDTLMRCLN